LNWPWHTIRWRKDWRSCCVQSICWETQRLIYSEMKNLEFYAYVTSEKKPCKGKGNAMYPSMPRCWTASNLHVSICMLLISQHAHTFSTSHHPQTLTQSPFTNHLSKTHSRPKPRPSPLSTKILVMKLYHWLCNSILDLSRQTCSIWTQILLLSSNKDMSHSARISDPAVIDQLITCPDPIKSTHVEKLTQTRV
jgi:hypothetical protein